MNKMLSLIASVSSEYADGVQGAILHWPDKEANQDNDGERKPMDTTRVMSLSHATKTVSELDADDNNLQGDEEFSNVLETDSQPSVEDAAILTVGKECFLERRRKGENDTDGSTDRWWADELSGESQHVLNARMQLVPYGVLSLRGTTRCLLRVSWERARKERCSFVGLSVLFVRATLIWCIVMSRSVPQICIHSIDWVFVTDSKKGSTETKGEHVGDDGTDEEEGLGSINDCVAGVIVGLCKGRENTS